MLTKKDTILIGVLINTALLAILFITAIVYDVEMTVEDEQKAFQLAETSDTPSNTPAELMISPVIVESSGDEVDNILKYYATTEEDPNSLMIQHKEFAPPTHDEVPPVLNTGNNQEMVEITIKRGDTLEKIAKANETTISTIKKINQLSNEKLAIGQVLKVPVKKKRAAAANSTLTSNTSTINDKNTEAQYYVIKSGDNPWKLSKQFNVKYEDILRLNNLNEEKARNMRTGDRIRIK
jgi:peptidoglycan DL-endopeptidase LytF